MQDLPSGPVGFLFSDIEGSTRRWERDREAIWAAVERHFALPSRAIEAHRGVLFKQIDDAAQAAVPTGPEAVAAALAGQWALGAELCAADGPPVVGMAIHAVEAAPDERGDYLALCLNRLARLMAAGHGGQVLLSAIAEALRRTDELGGPPR